MVLQGKASFQTQALFSSLGADRAKHIRLVSALSSRCSIQAWVELSTCQPFRATYLPVTGVEDTLSRPQVLATFFAINETDTVINIWILGLFPELVRIQGGGMQLTTIPNFQEAIIFMLCLRSPYLDHTCFFLVTLWLTVKYKYSEVGEGVGRAPRNITLLYTLAADSLCKPSAMVDDSSLILRGGLSPSLSHPDHHSNHHHQHHH